MEKMNSQLVLLGKEVEEEKLGNSKSKETIAQLLQEKSDKIKSGLELEQKLKDLEVILEKKESEITKKTENL